MTTPEGKIEKHLVDRVRATGGVVRKLKWLDRSGAPDRMVWWPPEHPARAADIFFVELKAPKKKPNVEQLKEHKKMRDSGLRVIVIDSEEKIDAFVKAPMFYRGEWFRE